MQSVHSLLEYSDAMNLKLLDAAGEFTDAQLDQPFDIGMKTLRRTLIHIYVGEYVWLQRQLKNVEQRWLSETDLLSIVQLRGKFEKLWVTRDEFVDDLVDEDVEGDQTYRDSKGSVYRAGLLDMILQGIVHSVHHRAQASTMLKQVGASPVDLDYMYWLRQPVVEQPQGD